MDIESNSKESEKMVAEISPLLKFVLELGPLVVFFFANSRGEWLATTFPVLTEFGGPIFIATGLFMIATAIALSVSWVLTRKLPIMPLISGIVVFVFGASRCWLQAAASLHFPQDEADNRQHAVWRHSAGRPVLRAVAARLRLQFRLQAYG